MAVGLGCANARPRGKVHAPWGLSASEYRHVYREWTRHAAHYGPSGLELEVWATFQSPDFRRAWARRYASVYRLPRDRFEELLREQLATAARSLGFVVTVQAHEWSWRDLRDDTPVWRMALRTPGARMLPAEIQDLDKPEVAIAEFFPDVTTFSRTYRVRFDPSSDRAPQGESPRGPMTLIFYGPLGQIELRWEERRDAAGELG